MYDKVMIMSPTGSSQPYQKLFNVLQGFKGKVFPIVSQSVVLQ
jgi:hypothetical protein